MNNLKSLLAERGVRQCDIVAKLGVARSSVCDWASGRRAIPAKHAARIEDYLGVRRGLLSCEGLLTATETGPHDGKPYELTEDGRVLANRGKHYVVVGSYLPGTAK